MTRPVQLLIVAFIVIAVIALSGCAAFMPPVPTPAPTPVQVVDDRGADPYTTVEVRRGSRGDFKEIGIIEGLSDSGCDIRHFETTTGPASRSAIKVDCK